MDGGHVRMNRRLGFLPLLVLMWMLAGCEVAAVHLTPESLKPNKYVLSDPEKDPYERLNRKVFNFNNWVDNRMLRPVAVVYRDSVPDPVRMSVGNFFNNLDYPLVVLNQFLQGKPGLGFQDLARFGINSTLGFGGLFDVATDMGFAEHQEDFGQTLSIWGFPDGPFAVAPFIGPGATLDFVNTATVIFVDAGNLIADPTLRYSTRVAELVSQRAEVLGFEQLQFGDPYIFQRDAYLQRRAFLVRDGAPVEDDEFLSESDDLFLD